MTKVQGAYAKGPFHLQHFNETSVLNLKWIGGNVLVQGRLFIGNEDGDRQRFQVWLTYGHPRKTIDYIEWNLPGKFGSMVTLSGWAFSLPRDEIIEILCATYDGDAWDPRMTATFVDEFPRIKPVEEADRVSVGSRERSTSP
jgi:hypothetical protein